VANQTGRPVAPARKLVAAVLGTLAVFVMVFGLGLSSWAIVVLGLAVLALSIALGTVAQIAQAQLVAARRPHAAALAWLGGLVALLAVGLAAAPPVAAATIGQLAAAGIVLGALVIAGRKP
jgi:hypothetical protein